MMGQCCMRWSDYCHLSSKNQIKHCPYERIRCNTLMFNYYYKVKESIRTVLSLFR